MPKPKTGNTALLQVRITPEQLVVLQKMAESQNTTIAELMRRSIRQITRNAALLLDETAA